MYELQQDENLYETIRSMELAFDYSFTNEEIQKIIKSYYISITTSKL